MQEDLYPDVKGGELPPSDDVQFFSTPGVTGDVTEGLCIGQFRSQRSSLQSRRISDQFMPAPEERRQQQPQQPPRAPPILHTNVRGTPASGVRFSEWFVDVPSSPAAVRTGKQSHKFVRVVDVTDEGSCPRRSRDLQINNIFLPTTPITALIAIT